ncbi:hypothetical protein ONE63_002252 [Megalurothrips usitatus]|uniref:Uncharacterized protein n=1 Tax=Megalurothrips usitatus TaxID=439358 RepID=A0AAV7XE79_9NEOP|nr:hypothetical protein ONE63_002252 [Megalurothrips usitatus]
MTFGERRLNTLLHGKPLTPDEENGDFGFLYARSLSLSVDDDAAANNSSPTASVKGRALRNRVFGQTWCSASSCPVAAALTLSNTTARHRKLGQGEAVVACLDCSFSAASVSIVDGDAVCAAASSSNMPKGVCIAVCQSVSPWEGVDCSCAAGCSASELGSESVHSYAYQVVAGTAARDLLAFLHRLMVRVHNTAEHLNMAAQLDVPGKTRQVRANVEKRFGKEKAKAVPLLTANNGLQ